MHNQHFEQLEFQSNCLLKRALDVPPLLLKTSWFSNSSSSKYQGDVKKIVSCWPGYRHGQWTWTWTGSLAWDWKWQGGRSCRENVSGLEMSERGVVTNITIILLFLRGHVLITTTITIIITIIIIITIVIREMPRGQTRDAGKVKIVETEGKISIILGGIIIINYRPLSMWGLSWTIDWAILLRIEFPIEIQFTGNYCLIPSKICYDQRYSMSMFFNN